MKKNGLLARMRKILITIILGIVLIPIIIVGMMIWAIFRAICNFVGLSWAKWEDDELKMPVIFYKHPQTGRRAVLIGENHIGNSSYYASLQEVIDSLSGYTALCEGLSHLTLEQRRGLNPDERIVAKIIEDSWRIRWKRMRRFGWVSCKTLVYKGEVIYKDLTLYEVARLIANNGFKYQPMREPNWKKADPAADKVREEISRYAENAIGSFVISNIIHFFSRPERARRKVYLDVRETTIFAAAQQCLEQGKDILLPWGAGHVPGFHRRLLQAGFQEVRREWHTVCQKENVFLEWIGKKLAIESLVYRTAAMQREDKE